MRKHLPSMKWISRYDEALTTADNNYDFKLAVKTIAKHHGLHATFMPKPRKEFCGSVCTSTCHCVKTAETYLMTQMERERTQQRGLLLHGRRDEAYEEESAQ